MFSSNRAKITAAGIAAIMIGGGSYGIVAATSGSSTTTTTATSHPFAGGAGSGATGSNARSGPAAGGTTGTVSSLSTSGFTVSTSTGEKVTIKEASSPTYENGTAPASATAITAGEPV